MKVKKVFSHLLVGMTCLSILGACAQGGVTSKSNTKESKSSINKKSIKQVNKGRIAEDFALTDVNGKKYKLSDFKGKKVYLKFWASWCSICLASLADTDELAAKKDSDTVILSIVSPNHNGEKSEEDFKKWYKSLNYKSLPVLIDPEGKLLKEYNIRSYPSAAFIGTDGVITKTQAGFMDKDSILKELKHIK